MREYLKDKNFMKILMERRDRTTYVRITALNLDLTERNEIVGYATEGSINVDGASAVRRSCNLTLVTEQTDIKDYEWALSTRFRLEIGMKNNTLMYPTEDIIWFPQGVYIITSFSAALGANSYTISISGQDKMCLMNGEVSGQVTAETDFGKYDELTADGKTITHDLTLREIITSLVHTYGLEPLENIVIDLPDDSAYNLLTYRGEDPLYILRNADTNKVENFTFMGQIPCYTENGAKSLKDLGSYWQPDGIEDAGSRGMQISWNAPAEDNTLTNPMYVQKVEYGQSAGYEQTPLTFAGELKAAAGEAVTNVLDKIKNMLGDFEYFYDVEGTFRFQKKKTYLKTYMNDESALEVFAEGEYSYQFNDLSMFTSFNTNPNLKNLKNDFTVWGEYKTATGAALPIHMRIAIDKKPTKYVSFWQNKTYYTIGHPNIPENEKGYDWRELIYQMAIDYQNHHLELDYGEILEATNPDFVTGGRTGYEQYYTDLLGFWRLLYEPDCNRAITAWNKVSGNNLDVEKFYYPWVNVEAKVDDSGNESLDFITTEQDDDGNEIETKHYISWYVNKVINDNNYRIRWMDSLDLSPSTFPMYYSTQDEVIFYKDQNNQEVESLVSVRRLFRKDKATGVYSSLLGNTLLESSYYVYERCIADDVQNQVYGQRTEDLVNLATSKTWGIEENLSKLYLKRPEDPIEAALPMQLKCPVEKIRENRNDVRGYRPGIYCKSHNSTVQVYDSFQYYTLANVCQGKQERIQWWREEDMKKVIDAFNPSNNYIVYLYYSTNPDGTRTKYDPTTMEAYAMRAHSVTATEGYSHALYIKQDTGELKLYAQHLMDDGFMSTNETAYQVLDEAWLKTATPGKGLSPQTLDQNLVIDRDNLYRKNSDNEYVPAFEDINLLPKDKEGHLQVQMQERGVELIEGEGIGKTEPLTEPYYATNMKGELITSTTLFRPLDYWTYQTDYNLETYWNKQVQDSPETLLFWFNFLDPREYPDLLKYSVSTIGDRPMVKNEKNVKAIFYPTVPDIYFGTDCPLEEGSKKYFTISSQGQSAHDTIDSWLYNHTYITESVSINSIPMYNLEPNSKIKIEDEEHGIYGDYIVDKLTIPLSYSGTMSITATKAPETF